LLIGGVVAEFVRLFGAFYPHGSKPVASMTLRVDATGLPSGGVVQVTDVQLEPGSFVTGWTLASQDLGVQPVDGWQFRNGVVKPGLPVVVIADVEVASPTRWDVRSAGLVDVRVGGFQFGATGLASVDGWAHTATVGAGLPPVLTAVADCSVDFDATARVVASCWYRGQTLVQDTSHVPPVFVDQDTVTAAHRDTWSGLLAFHDDWASVIDTHAVWR
jgi:hypothetical protein